MYKLTTLKNKLRIITHFMPHSHGVTSGIFVGAGSRFEADNLAGISHFAEHMFYKGTEKRSTPADVARAIEGVGGYTNAATSQDYTFFYNCVPARHIHFALDFLADIINHSLFDEAAIQREKAVILEELNMYLDTPTRYIYDLIMKTVWPNNSLGRDIIGRRTSLAAISRASLMPYLENTYQPQNMVLVVAGKVSHAEVVRDVKKYFAQNKNGRVLRFKKVTGGQTQARVLIHS
ncbi:peptidase M16, partial [Candidatus Kuenenbacteria bacterium CG22_combo_CG10-13_8_21_14_all_39_9]